MKKLTSEYVAQFAHAALSAACDKAEESGFDRFMGLEGILLAADAIDTAGRIHDALGSEGFDSFLSFLESEAASETIKRAEDILRGEE